MKITVVGTGYVGLVLGACLAENGNEVICIDKDTSKIDTLNAGRVPIYEAAMSKVFVGELQERLGEAALDILGAGGLLSEEAPSAPLPEAEQELRHSLMGVLGGGTSEMQRNTIALRGLGLPRMAS